MLADPKNKARKEGREMTVLEIESISVKELRVSPLNVRKRIGELDGLEASIKSTGLLQPIVVREAEGRLEVVVGQRRFLSCKALGWHTIPAIKRKLSDREALILSLTENVQMDSIDPIDRAEGTEKLIKDLEKEMPRTKAVDAVAATLGKGPSTVYDWLRLLETAEAVKRMVQDKKIETEVGARLASLPKGQQAEVAKVIHEESLSRPQAIKAIEYVSRRPKAPSKAAIKTFLRETEEYSITVSLPGSLYKVLSEFAQTKKLTIQEIIRRAIRKFLGL